MLFVHYAYAYFCKIAWNVAWRTHSLGKGICAKKEKRKF